MSKSKNFDYSNLIHRKLSEILLRESKDPRFQRVTISRVEPSRDLSYAKVFFSVYPQTDSIEDLVVSLNRAAGFFSTKLGKSLKTRNTPKLSFVYDPGFDHTSDIDELLKSIR